MAADFEKDDRDVLSHRSNGSGRRHNGLSEDGDGRGHGDHYQVTRGEFEGRGDGWEGFGNGDGMSQALPAIDLMKQEPDDFILWDTEEELKTA